MRIILLSLICLTTLACFNEEKSETINKTILNQDLEGCWLSVDYIKAFNDTKSINATRKLLEVWTELNFSKNGQLNSHTTGGGLTVSYHLDTNYYTFFDTKFVWDSGESFKFHYDTVTYEITHLIEDTLYIIQDNKETIKYVKVHSKAGSFNPFPSSWSNFTEQLLLGKHKFEFSNEDYDLVFKEKKHKLEGFKNYSNWSFYSEFDQDIILFRSTLQTDKEDLTMDELYFIVDSTRNESIYLTLIVTPNSGRLKSIIKTDTRSVLKRN